MFKKFVDKIPVKTKKSGQNASDRLTVIRNFTLEPFFDLAMSYYSPRMNIEYLYLEQCILDDFTFTNDVFIILHLPYLMSDIYYNYYIFPEEERQKLISEQIDYLIERFMQIMDRVKNNYTYMALFVSPDLDGVLDGQKCFESVIADINNRLIALSKDNNRLTLINTHLIAKNVGISRFFDLTGTYSLDYVLSRYSINCIAHELTSKICQNLLPVKCIVLDCDNVLWGGIIDEVGMTGILLSNQGIGRAYRDFQRELLKLMNQGFLLCICSKNEERVVKSVFDTNPYMLLKWDDLCAKKVSFSPKSQSILELANELNLPVQEMLFVDDSPYEIEEVSTTLAVETLLLDPAKPHKFIQELYASGCFFKDFVSESDLTRTEQYKRSFHNLINARGDDSNNKLETTFTIRDAESSDLRRVSELSYRTHQFNMSNIKYDVIKLKSLISKPTYRILVLQAKDCFGDLGIVAAAVVETKNNATIIESFWVSCRVFGRELEKALINSICENTKTKSLFGLLSETELNKPFCDFYEQNGISVLFLE